MNFYICDLNFPKKCETQGVMSFPMDTTVKRDEVPEILQFMPVGSFLNMLLERQVERRAFV